MYFSDEQLEAIENAMSQFSVLRDLEPSAAYVEIYRITNLFIEQPAYKAQLTCGSVKNCSMCCHDTIPMGLMEGRIMRELIKHKKIEYNKDRVIAQNSGKKLSWEEKACPMLRDLEDGNRLCGMYEWRPLICRTHNSISHPDVCYPDTDAEDKGEIMCAELVALAFISYGLAGNHKDGEIPKMTSMHEILKEIEDEN